MENEISLRELIHIIQGLFEYLKKQSKKIIIASIFGGLFGFSYVYFQPVKYTAKTTFVVEEAKSGVGLSSLASLAGQFGVDLGSNSGGNLISGENVILYFKSESLVRSVLLSDWDKNNSFASQYLTMNDIKKKIEKKLNLKDFKIPSKTHNHNYTRIEDSIIQELTSTIIEKELVISRPDKKAGFIELSTSMKNEEFSKRFNEQLVKSAIDQYVGLKTERQKKTVQRLQERADSIGLLLNLKTSASASIQTSISTMDLNPLYRTPSSIRAELTLRDKTMLGAIYIEVVKNLEMAKFTLSQETPVIQIVDVPIYPLFKNKESKLQFVLLFALLFATITSLFLTFRNWLNRNLSKDDF